MYEHKKKKSGKTMIFGENNLMQYFANSTSNENLEKNQVSDYMVGIWDRERAKIKLVSVDNFYTMSQKAKRAKEYKPTTDHMLEDMEYFEKKNELVNVFGTKKAKSKMQQLKNNIVEDPSGQGSSEQKRSIKIMDKNLKMSVLNVLAEEEKKKGEGKADSEEKYVLSYNDLIPKELHELINYKELYKQLFDEKEVQDDLYYSYERTTIHCMKYMVRMEKQFEKGELDQLF
jgi:hypothetical protein